jgi:hypothetical protein
MIEQKPFVRYNIKDDKDFEVFTVKMNSDEMSWLMDGAIRLRQPKKSTALKQLAEIGYAKVLQDEKVLESLANNARKNRRLGVDEMEQDIVKSWQK